MRFILSLAFAMRRLARWVDENVKGLCFRFVRPLREAAAATHVAKSFDVARAHNIAIKTHTAPAAADT